MSEMEHLSGFISFQPTDKGLFVRELIIATLAAFDEYGSSMRLHNFGFRCCHQLTFPVVQSGKLKLGYCGKK